MDVRTVDPTDGRGRPSAWTSGRTNGQTRVRKDEWAGGQTNKRRTEKAGGQLIHPDYVEHARSLETIETADEQMGAQAEL